MLSVAFTGSQRFPVIESPIKKTNKQTNQQTKKRNPIKEKSISSIKDASSAVDEPIIHGLLRLFVVSSRPAAVPSRCSHCCCATAGAVVVVVAVVVAVVVVVVRRAPTALRSLRCETRLPRVAFRFIFSVVHEIITFPRDHISFLR